VPISGPKVLLASALIVVSTAGVAGYVMYTEKPRAGDYIDAVALEGDFVVGVRGETTRGRAFVELVGIGEGMRWQALLPSYAVPEGAVGVAASEHAVTVRFPRDGHTQVWGFAAQSAKKLGAITLASDLPGQPDGGLAPGVATLSAGALAFEVLQPDGRPLRVDAVSLERGAVAWTRELAARGLVAAWPTGDHLVLDQGATVTAIAEDGAHAWTAPSSPATCVVPAPPGGDDLVIVHAEDGIDLVHLHAGAEVRREHVALGAGVEPAGQCGRRRDRIFLTANDADGALVIAVRGGEPPARTRLGAGAVRPGPQRANAPLSEPFAGTLDATEVLAVHERGAARLVAIDLDGGRIAWQSQPAAALDAAILVDAGPTVLVGTPGRLAAIDRTGAARAVRIPGGTGLRPHHVAAGAVWVVGARGLLALDAATLARRGDWRTAPEVRADPNVLADFGLPAPH